MDLSGRTALLYQGKVWLRNPKGTGWQEATGFPEADTGVRLEDGYKFREGTLYRRMERILQVWDSKQRRWASILVAPDDFQDFEIIEGGDLVLLGTNGSLIQIHAPRSAHPLVRVPYPDLGFTEAQANFTNWWKLVRSYTLAGRLVLYYPRCGRLFTYDALEGKLRDLDTPWESLDRETLPRHLKQGRILDLTSVPGVGCIQFIPLDPQRVALAYEIQPQEVSMELEGNSLKSLQHKPRVDRPGGTFTAVLDLASGSVSSPKPHAGVRLPLWVLSEDQVVPLQDLLKTLGPSASPKVPKAPAPGP